MTDTDLMLKGGRVGGGAKRVLVADDEKPIARALQLKLRSSGFEVETALDGEEVLALLKKKEFDLLVLDLVMPNMDGFRVLEELRKLHLEIPVIVSSNLSQEVDAERVKAYGIKNYFVKSESTIADVVACVKQVLQ